MYSPMPQYAEYDRRSLQELAYMPALLQQRDQEFIKSAQDQIFDLKYLDWAAEPVQQNLSQFKQKRDQLVDRTNKEGWNPQVQQELSKLNRDWYNYSQSQEGEGYRAQSDYSKQQSYLESIKGDNTALQRFSEAEQAAKYDPSMIGKYNPHLRRGEYTFAAPVPESGFNEAVDKLFSNVGFEERQVLMDAVETIKDPTTGKIIRRVDINKVKTKTNNSQLEALAPALQSLLNDPIHQESGAYFGTIDKTVEIQVPKRNSNGEIQKDSRGVPMMESKMISPMEAYIIGKTGAASETSIIQDLSRNETNLGEEKQKVLSGLGYSGRPNATSFDQLPEVDLSLGTANSFIEYATSLGLKKDPITKTYLGTYEQDQELMKKWQKESAISSAFTKDQFFETIKDNSYLMEIANSIQANNPDISIQELKEKAVGSYNKNKKTNSTLAPVYRNLQLKPEEIKRRTELISARFNNIRIIPLDNNPSKTDISMGEAMQRSGIDVDLTEDGEFLNSSAKDEAMDYFNNNLQYVDELDSIKTGYGGHVIKFGNKEFAVQLVTGDGSSIPNMGFSNEIPPQIARAAQELNRVKLDFNVQESQEIASQYQLDSGEIKTGTAKSVRVFDVNEKTGEITQQLKVNIKDESGNVIEILPLDEYLRMLSETIQ